MTGESFVQLAIAGGSAGGGFALVFVIVRWTANFIAGRLDKREDRVDAGTRLLFDAFERQIVHLQEECSELRERIAKAETDLLDCLRKHAESEARWQRAEAVQAGLGDAKQHAALIVAAEKRKGKE